VDVTAKSPPSIEEIQAEARLADRLLQRTVERINASNSDVREILHLELCRTEQQAYIAGLLFALGHPTLVDRLEVLYGLEVPGDQSK
jgi:hypothetical protein